MPNTAVFFPAINELSLSILGNLAFRFDGQFADDFAFTGNFRRLAFDRMLLFFGADGPFQRDLPVLGDHLHVVSVSGKALVRLNGLSNLLCELTIGTIVLLLICSRFVGIPVSLIHLGVVVRWCGLA